MSRSAALRVAVAVAVVAVVAVLCGRASAEVRIGNVNIVGHTVDDAGRLLRFLGLEPGSVYASRAEVDTRLDEILKALKYLKLRDSQVTLRKDDAGRDVVDVKLVLSPALVVRHVKVSGNWPLFDDEIKRRLTLRPGSTLAADPEQREKQLAAEAQRVKDFLEPYGYFGSSVVVVTEPAGRPEWTNVRVRLSRGHRYRLDDVEVKGATVFDHRDMLRYFGPRWYQPGYFGRLRLDRLRDDARDVEKAYQEKGYPAARVFPEAIIPERDLNPRTRTARLRVSVTEKDRVVVEFQGNKSLTDKELRSRLTILAAGSYDEVELSESARELFRLYQSNGYLEARVTWRRTATPTTPPTSASAPPSVVIPNARVQVVTFEIEEGPQLKVRSIEFVPEPGAAPLSADGKELRAVIATRVFPRIGELGLGEGGYITNVQLQQDLEKLVAFEHGRGYPAARARAELARDPAAFGNLGVMGADVADDYTRPGGEHDLYVRYFLDEGPHQTIGSVTVNFAGSQHARGAAELVKLMDLEPGAPFSPDALQAARKRVVDLYATHGHPYAELAPPVIAFDPSGAARIVMLVDEGPEVRFGEVLVRGNFRTAESVIRRDLAFQPGDLFDTNKIAAAERNLQTHTLFNGVRVIPIGLAGRRVTSVPILVEVTQERYDDFGTPQLSIGYSTDVGLLGTVGYFWGNVFGGGGQLELRHEIALDLFQSSDASFPSGAFYRRLATTIRYVHPHLVWPAIRGEIAGYIRKENTVRLGEILSGGAYASVAWVPSPRFRLFLRYDWQLASLQSIDFQRLPGRGDQNPSVNDQTRTGKLSAGVVWDDRVSFDGVRNALMPVAGWLVAGSFAGASTFLGGSRDFLVVSGQLQRYQPLGRGVSLIGNLRGDWGFPLGGESSLPAVDRFFAGGDVATRGFGTDQLRTEIVRGDVSPSPGPGVGRPGIGYRIIPQGGNIRFLGTVELQFPIAKVAGFPWVGAIFADVGTLFDSPKLFDPAHDIKVSVGFTLLRLLTPVGPISLEYAYPITQTLAEQDWKRAAWYRHWPGLIHFNWGIPILR